DRVGYFNGCCGGGSGRAYACCGGGGADSCYGAGPRVKARLSGSRGGPPLAPPPHLRPLEPRGGPPPPPGAGGPPPAPPPPPPPPRRVTPDSRMYRQPTPNGFNTVSAGAANDAARATVLVRLPADARLYADGSLLRLTGPERRFVSPPLPAGQEFTYRFT